MIALILEIVGCNPSASPNSDGHLASSNAWVEDISRVSAALQDQIQNQLADSMNKVMYRFTWVATVFLPLGFITGLLGINVAGIPGDHDPAAFWLVCVSLVVIGVVWGIFVAWIIRPSKKRTQRKEN